MRFAVDAVAVIFGTWSGNAVRPRHLVAFGREEGSICLRGVGMQSTRRTTSSHGGGEWGQCGADEALFSKFGFSVKASNNQTDDFRVTCQLNSIFVI